MASMPATECLGSASAVSVVVGKTAPFDDVVLKVLTPEAVKWFWTKGRGEREKPTKTKE